MAYEWETTLEKRQIEKRIYWLRTEIKRISNVTLKGNFTNAEDRKYWIDRLTELNGQLLILENY